MPERFEVAVAIQRRSSDGKAAAHGGDGQGIRRTYCTVDDATATDPWSGPGYVELKINGRTVTLFDRICTTFDESWRQVGDRRIFTMEAYTREISQLGNSQHRIDPNQPYDIEFYSTLFQQGSVQFVNGVPTGTEIFTTPHVQFDRNCSEPWLYSFKSTGVNDLTSEVMSHADPIGKITFLFFESAPCIAIDALGDEDEVAAE